jgi:predicted metal-dependent hydrolase
MSSLKVRKLPFEFEGVDFIWNPKNPGFSMLMNQISFMTIGLEKYFCLAMRDAEAHIKDPVVLEEARLFRAQEMVHSQTHKKHVNALIKRYPGLEEAVERSVAMFDELYEKQPLKFHLGYAGGLEAMFTPFFGMIINNREALFGGGDSRVASLFLWHFCEEIEHRSSAISVYNDVVGDSWYRISHLRAFMQHGRDVTEALNECFKKHVPEVPESYYSLKRFDGVPQPVLRRTFFKILGSQLPWYDHENQELPAYYKEWYDRYESGEDMTNVFGVRPEAKAA